MYFGSGLMWSLKRLRQGHIVHLKSKVRPIPAPCHRELSSVILIHESDVNLRETGSVKISDAALMRLSSCKPIINAAVGLGRTLNELFEDTNQLLQGGLTRAVFILKIYENEPAAPVNPPWDTSRESFQVDEVLAYYRIHDIPLVGKLSVGLYLWFSLRRANGSSPMRGQSSMPVWSIEAAVAAGLMADGINRPLIQYSRVQRLKVLAKI